MKMKRITFEPLLACQSLLMVLAMAFLMQCSQATPPDIQADIQEDEKFEPGRLPTEMTMLERQLALSTNKFSFELFNRVSSSTSPDSNLFISPLSASYALAMAYNGAGGATRDSIAAALALDGFTTEEINQGFEGLADVLTGADPSVVTNIANAIWYSSNISLVPEYGEIVRTSYGAEVSGLDFRQSSTVDVINKWAFDNTNGKIKEIVTPPLDPDLVCLLANAVYFKADWTFPFKPELTMTDRFYLADGNSMSADYMRISSVSYGNEDGEFDSDITYLVKKDEFQAFSLPYGDRWFRMTVFLPDESVSVEQFISSFTTEQWGSWRSQFQAGEFTATLPKFRFEYETGLDDVLRTMGMEIAMHPATADFSSMIIKRDLWIDTVFQKTFVQVDEVGTEAAAITVVGISITGIKQVPHIDCNRPFAFVIWEKESGAIMFMGKVARPVWED